MLTINQIIDRTANSKNPLYLLHKLMERLDSFTHLLKARQYPTITSYYRGLGNIFNLFKIEEVPQSGSSVFYMLDAKKKIETDEVSAYLTAKQFARCSSALKRYLRENKKVTEVRKKDISKYNVYSWNITTVDENRVEETIKEVQKAKDLIKKTIKRIAEEKKAAEIAKIEEKYRDYEI